jgi:WAS/WASL-interacting protein
MRSLVVLCVSLFAAAVLANGIGDLLIVNAIHHFTMPITTADATANYDFQALTGECDPSVGVEYTYKGELSAHYPISLFFTTGGQIGGIGVTSWKQPSPGPQAGYWNTNANGTYQLVVSFRNASSGIQCNFKNDSAFPVGDSVIVQPSGQKFSVPLTAAAALAQSWTNGSCITTMGRHWAYDLQTAPDMSWDVANLFPIMPMYNEDTHVIDAILFNIADAQSVWPFGYWEGPFIPSLMCYNWCDSSCTFNTNLYSTMHWFFTNPALNTCAAHC